MESMERYTLDSEKFSMQLFFQLSRSRKMIPSRRCLQDNLDSSFKALESKGIENLQQLISLLGSKEKIASMASETGLSAHYLSLLKREAGSYLASPFPLSDFPGIPLEYTEILLSKGINNTRKFFESVQTSGEQQKISGSTGIPVDRLREIYRLCDLSRITGVGPVYARVIYLAGIHSVRDFAETDAATHNKLYMQVLDKYNYPLNDLGEDDIQYCIDYASLLVKFNSNPK